MRALSPWEDTSGNGVRIIKDDETSNLLFYQRPAFLKTLFPKSLSRKYNYIKKKYTNNQYPFQDSVLKLIMKVDDTFYLTGGTALGVQS